MGYYQDSYMECAHPDYKKVGTYYGLKNAEEVADWHSLDGDVKITLSEVKYNAEFYSVWVKKKTLVEKLLGLNLWE